MFLRSCLVDCLPAPPGGGRLISYRSVAPVSGLLSAPVERGGYLRGHLVRLQIRWQSQLGDRARRRQIASDLRRSGTARCVAIEQQHNVAKSTGQQLLLGRRKAGAHQRHHAGKTCLVDAHAVEEAFHYDHLFTVAHAR